MFLFRLTCDGPTSSKPFKRPCIDTGISCVIFDGPQLEAFFAVLQLLTTAEQALLILRFGDSLKSSLGTFFLSFSTSVGMTLDVSIHVV